MPEKAPKKGSLLNVPSRTSSQNKQDASATSPPLTGATMTDDSASVGRGSKRSILGIKRETSKSSTRRTSRAQKNSDTGKESTPAIAQSDGAAGAEKKKSSRFMSFLNCCSAGHGTDATGVDDQSVPAKKSKIQPLREKSVNQTERPKPANDVENVKDSEAKDIVDEKQGYKEEAPKEDIPPSVGKGQGSVSRRESAGEKPTVSPAIAAPTNTADSAPITRDQPVPTTSSDTPPVPIPPLATESLQPPAVTVQAPTPIIKQEEENSPPDWTPDQSKTPSDAEMPDAPSEEEEVVEHETTETPPLPKVEAQKTDLPPPPPLEQRQSQISTREVPAVPGSSQEKQIWLLPPAQPHLKGRKCLVLDLDETLVHSSFKILNQADFTIPVEIEGQYHNVYVIKRPGVDAFMKRVGELYEVVVFTASVSKYGDPLLDQLDIHHVVHHRLFRESCYNHQGNYVKASYAILFDRFFWLTFCQDLSQVGRDLRETIIIDNSPTSYIFHPQHAVPISSWFSDAHDNELLDLIPVLEDLAGSQVRDVSLVLDVAL